MRASARGLLAFAVVLHTTLIGRPWAVLGAHGKSREEEIYVILLGGAVREIGRLK